MAMLRWILLVVVVLGAMASASWFSTSPDWPAAVQWAIARHAQWQKEHRPCPVLHGEPVAGDAHAGYVEAVRLAEAVEDRDDRLHDLAEAPAARPLTGEERAQLAALAPALQALQQAARRRGARPSDAGPAVPMPDLVEMLRLVDALVITAADRFATDAGAAAELLLDGLRTGVDLMNGTVLLETLVGRTIVERCLAAFADGLLQALDAEGLLRLEAALATVDAALPPHRDHLPQLCLEMVARLRANEPLSSLPRGRGRSLRAWRYGFDECEWARAEVTEIVAIVAQFERMAPAAGARWSEVEGALEQLHREAGPVVANLHLGGRFDLVEAERGHRGIAARVRLLRMAVAFQQRREVPALRDPLGDGDLAVAVHGDEATFTSAEPSLLRTTRRR